jgi:N-acetylneuraminic acid mutarotase
MRSRNLIGFLCVMGFMVLACGLVESPVSTVEVTRIVRETAEVTRIVKVPHVVTKVVVVTATTPPKLTEDITQGSDLLFPRMWHTATRLLDGKILLVGGSRARDDFLADVELFDPATGISRRAASLHTPRHAHTATLLPDGRVLVVGGYSLPRQWLDDAEVYDPTVDTWTVVPPLYSHGSGHTATLMNDGRVLVVGGAIGSGVITERVEIFNPQTNAWAEAMSLESDRASQTANLLSDGRVLVAGGWGASNVPVGGNALVYNPQTNTWTATGPMVKMRIQAQSVRLPDGRVLVAGGITLEDVSLLKMSAKTEIYDPASNAWTATADLSQARYNHVLVLLPDGQVLAVGGARDYDNHLTENSFVREIERYDPVANDWRIVGELPQPREHATATLLLDGRVWVTGGRYLATHWSDTYLIALPYTHP